MYQDLQPYCEDYHCSYAAVATPDNDAFSISYVLRFPFIKVYALNEDRKAIPELRKRFEANNRIQIFFNAHCESFFEMSRMIPVGCPAIFVLKAHEQTLLNWLSNVAINRPRKNDVILAINEDPNDSAIINQVSRLFGYTHEIGMIGQIVRIVPMMKF